MQEDILVTASFDNLISGTANGDILQHSDISFVLYGSDAMGYQEVGRDHASHNEHNCRRIP